VAMIFKLLETAEGRWRRLNGYRLVPLVRAGARFVNRELVERIEEHKDAARSELDPQLRECGRRCSVAGLTQIHKGQKTSALQMIRRPNRGLRRTAAGPSRA